MTLDTWAIAKEDPSMPIVAIAPPSIAVRLNPTESIIIPARGEIRKVIPIDKDPTKASVITNIYCDV